VLIGVGVFIYVKNCIFCAEPWVDEGFKMIAVQVKGIDPKYTWEFMGIYRAPYEDIRMIERLIAPTGYSRNSTKRGVIGGDVNLSQADWNRSAEGTSGNQAFVNKLLWENGYTQVLGSSTRGDALLHFSFSGRKTQFSISIMQGVSDHCGVLLGVEWSEICRATQMERLIPVYHKTDFLGLQTFLRDKFARWTGNGSCVEEIRKNVKEMVFESIAPFVPQTILKKKSDP